MGNPNRARRGWDYSTLTGAAPPRQVTRRVMDAATVTGIMVTPRPTVVPRIIHGVRMADYFFLLDATLFAQSLRPAFAASWTARSVAPLRPVAEQLLPAAE